jgi:protein phosphatase
MVDEASEAIRTYGEAHPESYGLGTTLCGLAAVDVAGPCWAVFNVGDSRVYRFLGGRLERATIDHTEVELLVRAGVITPTQARYHPARNVVTSRSLLPAALRRPVGGTGDPRRTLPDLQ